VSRKWRPCSLKRNRACRSRTDGLVERRGEDLDDGLARLKDAATTEHGELRELLARLVAEQARASSEDDTAIVGLRWSE